MELSAEQLKGMMEAYAEMTNQLVEVNRNLVDISEKNTSTTREIKEVNRHFSNGFKKEICDNIYKSVGAKIRMSTRITILSILGIISGLTAILGYITNLVFKYKFDGLVEALK